MMNDIVEKRCHRLSLQEKRAARRATPQGWITGGFCLSMTLSGADRQFGSTGGLIVGGRKAVATPNASC